MKISLMTLNIVAEMFFKFQLDQDFEEFANIYDEMLDLVKECGYSVVDVTTMETMIFTVDGVKKKLEEHGLKAGSYIYMEQLASMDEAHYEECVQQTKEAVDAAVALGTLVLMLAPQAHEGIENDTLEQIQGSLIRHFTPVTEYAKEKGIHVVVEDTPDLRLHFCAMDELQAVLDSVPGLEMVYDSGNMLLVGEDPVAYYENFAKKTAHVHLKDMRMADPQERFVNQTLDGRFMTGAPIGTGLVDLESTVKCLKQHGYEGYVTIEFVVDEEKDYRRTLIQSREYIEKLIAG